MADKDNAPRRVSPDEAPMGVRSAAYSKAAEEANKKENWPINPYKTDTMMTKAADEAANEWARENNRNVPVSKKKGGTVRSSASKRADGIAQRGHTKGRYL